MTHNSSFLNQISSYPKHKIQKVHLIQIKSRETMHNAKYTTANARGPCTCPAKRALTRGVSKHTHCPQQHTATTFSPEHHSANGRFGCHRTSVQPRTSDRSLAQTTVLECLQKLRETPFEMGAKWIRRRCAFAIMDASQQRVGCLRFGAHCRRFGGPE